MLNEIAKMINVGNTPAKALTVAHERKAND